MKICFWNLLTFTCLLNAGETVSALFKSFPRILLDLFLSWFSATQFDFWLNLVVRASRCVSQMFEPSPLSSSNCPQRSKIFRFFELSRSCKLVKSSEQLWIMAEFRRWWEIVHIWKKKSSVAVLLMVLTDRNMQDRFWLKTSVYFWGLEIWVSINQFSKNYHRLVSTAPARKFNMSFHNSVKNIFFKTSKWNYFSPQIIEF